MTNFLILSFAIAVGIQIIGGTIAILNRTDIVTDLSYGLTFVLLAIANLWRAPELSTVVIVCNLIVIAWGLRLASFLFSRILKTKTDPRFDDIRGNPAKFAGFWALQAVSVWIIILPVTIISSQPLQMLGFWPIVGILISAVGVVIEATADAQKSAYKRDPAHKQHWTDVGLWKYSRHPNYFGEMLVWWGLWLVLWGNLPALTAVLAVISPIYITALLLFVTGVPLLEQRYMQQFEDNIDYLAYKSSTSLIIPLPPRKLPLIR